MADMIRMTDEVRIVDKTRFAAHSGDVYTRVIRAENNAIVREILLASSPTIADFNALTNLDEVHDIDDPTIKYVKSGDGGSTFVRYAMPPGTLVAYTLNATIVEDRTLLASASATATNNNNVLAALIVDLRAANIIA